MSGGNRDRMDWARGTAGGAESKERIFAVHSFGAVQGLPAQFPVGNIPFAFAGIHSFTHRGRAEQGGEEDADQWG